ncbi:hypothetical protein NIES4072_42760 [Nostoc commune NIES-4072]|uniref:Uncharacterized protein n=1 Tax=Nostoc commune NIES-4072 TaxID=2005467 RepID=A0A2R5FQL6_NOSCO|nr:hypothetical protein NIES4070_48070 [Nostoc commune HK-02]GBG20595.1 hypothetical protein NIES4072_42760 [Nostoc commune NIES-4072]
MKVQALEKYGSAFTQIRVFQKLKALPYILLRLILYLKLFNVIKKQEYPASINPIKTE